MLLRKVLSLILVMFVALFLIDRVKAFTLMPDPWRPTPPETTVNYAFDASFSGRTNWVNRANEAAANWTDSTIFNFIFNTNSTNRLRAVVMSCDFLAVMYPTEDAQGIYRSGFRIDVNVAPGCPMAINWYSGTGTPGGGQFDLRTVLRHEMGHAAGLNHVGGNTNQLMYFQVAAQATKTIGADEINGIDYLYNPTSGHRLTTSEFYWPGTTYDNWYPNVGYKGLSWTHGDGCCPLALGSGLAWSEGTGGTQWFPFVGDRITWQFTKHWNRGTQDIYIDGIYQTTYSSDDDRDTLWRTQKTWDVPWGFHVIEIRKQGGAGAYTDTDAFIVNVSQAPVGSYDSYGNSYVSYHGNWTHCTTCGDPNNPNEQPHNRTISWSNTPNDGVTMTFVGDGIRYYYTKAYNRGIVGVTIDGIEQPRINLYAPTQTPYNHDWQQSTYWSLPYGTHQISLVVTGDTTAPNPSYTYIDLDYFVVD